MNDKSTPRLILWQRMPGRLGRDEQLLSDHAKELGLAVVTASEKQMERGKVDLDADCIVAGTVPFVRSALRQLGAELPLHTPYPDALKPWFHRKVERHDHLRDVLHQIDAGGGRAFVKPADGWKRFTGFVVEHGDDYRLQGASKSAPVWVSEPVDFVSEWRAYVANGAVLDVRFADHGGDASVKPDEREIHAAVSQLFAAGTAPAGFVIDFGVLEDGRTALIEMNDGFSFGAYGGVAAKTYWAVIAARWPQLCHPAITQ